MMLLRVAMLVLAVVQTLFTGLTAAVGAFADGGDVWSRLLIVGLHPVCAIGLLILAARPRLPAAIVLLIGALLAVNIAADLYVASLISQGSIKGDWELLLVFSVIPAIGILYALMVLIMRPRWNPA